MQRRRRLKSTPKASRPPAAEGDASQRLQKVLAGAGLGSRRQCEELITTGRVEVDRKVVTELGTKVDPMQQEIRVDGTPLPRPKLRHYAVNKPLGVVTTNRDQAGRPRVIDLVRSDERLFAVGRLDMYSEGLIIVTNDGELANLLTHPRYGVEKTYQVVVAGAPDADVLVRLRHGIHLAEGFAHAQRITVKKQLKNSTILEMVLDEGRNREVRRLLARVGHKVLRLKRIAIGPLRLADLPVGDFRPLRREEVRDLRHAALSAKKHKAPTSGPLARPERRIDDQEDVIAPGVASTANVPQKQPALTKVPNFRKGQRPPRKAPRTKPGKGVIGAKAGRGTQPTTHRRGGSRFAAKQPQGRPR